MYGSSVHSDQWSEVLHDVDEEPDQGSDMVLVTSEPTGQSSEIDQQPEPVHFACVWEFHHYQVEEESDDGEPSQDNDDDDYPPRDVGTPPIQYEDRDGQLWSYDENFIKCNHAIDHGQDCESPVEHHWIESKAPEWFSDSNERENSPKCDKEDDEEEEEDLTDELLDE